MQLPTTRFQVLYDCGSGVGFWASICRHRRPSATASPVTISPVSCIDFSKLRTTCGSTKANPGVISLPMPCCTCAITYTFNRCSPPHRKRRIRASPAKPSQTRCRQMVVDLGYPVFGSSWRHAAETLRKRGEATEHYSSDIICKYFTPNANHSAGSALRSKACL